MKLHNTYSYGQLFCFSGLDGQTSRRNDFVGMFMSQPVTVRFHFETTVTLHFDLPDAEFSAVTGDMLDGDDLLALFVNCHTIVGKSRVLPTFWAEKELSKTTLGDTMTIVTDFGKSFCLTVKLIDGWYYFNFSYDKQDYSLYNGVQLDEIKRKRYNYFAQLPPCNDARYEQMYYKCLSINKENVYSPEGLIPCRWTTPDRIPHRFMWLWDSAFHALAICNYNMPLAKESILAVLSQQSEDGFIAHMMSPDGQISNVTQPQVLAWAVWNVYLKDRDKTFLQQCAEPIEKFLLWTMANRDKNGNGLLEWLTDPDYLECKCGESGLDNSPRFDFDVDLDAVDFTTYLCNDAHYLALIFGELGNKQKAEYFRNLHDKTKKLINDNLWCEQDGLYYDRLFDGNLTHVATSISFLPMFAGICSQEQADKMVQVLTDEKRFWTAFPVPTIPVDSPLYDVDMWRGCSWLNLNYFVIIGLRKYGYNDLADKLRQITLDTVAKWYGKTGNVFEFFDANDKLCPFELKRKGEPVIPPDYRKHIHAITDYNWSACFTLLLIWNVHLD